MLFLYNCPPKLLFVSIYPIWFKHLFPFPNFRIMSPGDGNQTTALSFNEASANPGAIFYLNGIRLNESFFLTKGSTPLVDGLYLFLLAPIGVIGFGLNLTCFLVFLNINIKSVKLYQYLKVSYEKNFLELQYFTLINST